MWTNTVLASGSAVGFVIYTGKDTRAVMNTNHPKTKSGLIDGEINQLSKVSKYVIYFRKTWSNPFQDLVYCYFGHVCDYGWSQWFPWSLVYLCF